MVAVAALLLLCQGVLAHAAAGSAEEDACMIQMPTRRKEQALLEGLPYETAEAIPVGFKLDEHHVSGKVVLLAGLVKALDEANADNIKSALAFCKFFDAGACTMSVMASEVSRKELRKILDVDDSFDLVRDPGDLSHEGPRPYMLAGFRNALLDHAREKTWDYLIVADLDNTVKWDDQTFGVVLNALDKEDQWDAVAFSSTNYYDWWAARCDKDSKNCLSHKVCNDRDEFPCIMEALQDSDTDHFRPVRSAFNGLAIYKKDALGDCRYDATNRDTSAPGHKDCEHVGFHDCLAEHGARFMLNSGRLHAWWSNLGDEPTEEAAEAEPAKDEAENSESAEAEPVKDENAESAEAEPAKDEAENAEAEAEPAKDEAENAESAEAEPPQDEAENAEP